MGAEARVKQIEVGDVMVVADHSGFFAYKWKNGKCANVIITAQLKNNDFREAKWAIF